MPIKVIIIAEKNNLNFNKGDYREKGRRKEGKEGGRERERERKSLTNHHRVSVLKDKEKNIR